MGLSLTWEIVVLISVIVLCGTIFSILKLILRARPDQNATSHKDIENRLSQIEAEHATIHQLAEQTKKLLSEANLVKGFRPQR